MRAADKLENLPSGIFLVRDDKAGLTVHAFDDIKGSTRRDVLKTLPAERPVRFTTHKARALRDTGSLAAFGKRFAGGPIVYDPTGVFGRAAEIVRCAGLLRAELGKKAGRILFDSVRRTLYVVLDDKAFSGKGLPFRAEVAEALAATAKIVKAWNNDFEFAVKIGFEPPMGLRLVAVDRQSERRPYRERLSDLTTRIRLAAGVAAVGAVTASAPALAGDKGDPTAAVALPNFTLIGQGGVEGGFGLHDNYWRGDAGVEGVVPLGHSFGLQAEGGVGTDAYYGAGGHLFWRDPDWAMLGGFVSYETLGGFDMTRYGAEAELYLDKLTLSARGGGQSGDIQDGGFGRIDLSFYLTPHFALRAGYENSPHLDFGRAGFEFQPAPESLSGLSLYADSTFGQGSEIMAGFRFHFGASGSSLIYRDRHEDPKLAIFNMLPLRAAVAAAKLAHPPYVGGEGSGGGAP